MARTVARARKAGKVAKKIKYVYFFGGGKAEGRGDMKDLLGGKGAGLAEMTSLGLPVPAGFTITTEACAEYYRLGRKFPPGLKDEVEQHVRKLERVTGKKFGDQDDPLLVSVRSGAAISMPGMMETILNLGLNDVSVEGLARRTGNPRFAYDSYRRFIQMYSTVVIGLSKDEMEQMLTELKQELGVKTDVEVSADGWKELCQRFKQFYRAKTGKAFPQDPKEQLWGAIAAVFNSWMAEKAVKYREVEKITGLKGTAVNVVQMVFGNKGDNSGTGVCFTRDPNSGEKRLYGDFLQNAQGEDVVAGIRTPMKLDEMKRVMPKLYRELERCATILERHYRDMQDIEFTIEEGKLYILQTRAGKRSPQAAFRIAVDMVRERLITKEEAVLRVKPSDLERLFYPVLDPSVPAEEKLRRRLTRGINAVPGAAVGEVVFTADEAEELAKAGHKVILVRKETSPEDVGGMHAAQGILTATGGPTSHAAVVARAWGKCCIVGAGEIEIDYDRKQFQVNGKVVKQGDFITLDGSDGSVYVGEFPLVLPQLPEAYFTLMKYADSLRTIRVRTNADTPYDAQRAREHGAEGIGLTRTEHMFFDTEERRLAMQEMILAETTEDRVKALDRLREFQRSDFEGIFRAMDGLPVTIRLLDPPLHEFLPHDEERQKELAERLGVPLEKVQHRVHQLKEANPMLGHRGCRLCITYPEILDMQVRAIMEAAVAVRKEGIKVLPEIMHPLIMDRRELEILAARTRQVADAVLKEAKVRIKYLVGTMIEVPRAALLAGEIAEVAEFFSFGTNDLTQMTMGLSRDDAGRFLPDYVDPEKAGVFKADPFQSLDVNGVGKLIRMAIEEGRKTRPDLKVGICGEHGGDPASVRFCVQVGMDYVSASPLRVPIARLAAAQAAVEQGLTAKAKNTNQRTRTNRRKKS